MRFCADTFIMPQSINSPASLIIIAETGSRAAPQWWSATIWKYRRFGSDTHMNQNFFALSIFAAGRERMLFVDRFKREFWIMRTKDFIAALRRSPDKQLLFANAEGQVVRRG